MKLANAFLLQMTRSSDPLLADLPSAVSKDSGFRMKGRLYFGEHFGFPRQTLAEQIVTAFASRRRTLQTIERKVACYIDTLLSLDSTRILNDFEQMIRESGRRLEVETREMLNRLRSTAEIRLAALRKHVPRGPRQSLRGCKC